MFSPRSTSSSATLVAVSRSEEGDAGVEITDYQDPPPLERNFSEELHDSHDHGTRHQHCCHKFINSVIVNVTIFLLIFLDATLLASRAALSRKDGQTQTVIRLQQTSFVLLSIFLLEILIRIFVLGIRKFIKNFWQVLDAFIVLGSFFVMLNIGGLRTTLFTSVTVLILQGIRICVRLAARGRDLPFLARQIVSTNKQRYVKHGFDLDLTYITDRMIAMGLPSTKMEAVYRNPIDEVARFFNRQHTNHYLIYNLCSEREYSSKAFQGRVARFPFDDHNPPTLHAMYRFCTHVEEFLAKDPLNVTAVHCKGGKGRTGTMICAWLLFTRPDYYAEQVLKLFSTRRTDQTIKSKSEKVQGVASPSQIRYIQYFENLRLRAPGASLRNLDFENILWKPPQVEFSSLVIHNILLKTKSLSNDLQKDDFNSGWNASMHWSLWITHYTPVPPSQEPPEHKPLNGLTGDHDEKKKKHKEVYTFTAKKKTYCFKALENDSEEGTSNSITIELKSWEMDSEALTLSGDLKFEIFRGSQVDLPDVERSPTTRDRELFCWFTIHTAFLPSHADEFVLQKHQLDEVCKNAVVDREFNVHLEYAFATQNGEKKKRRKKAS